MMPSSRPRGTLAWLGGALVVLAVLAEAFLTYTRLDRELWELPEPERRALYERTRETLRSS